MDVASPSTKPPVRGFSIEEEHLLAQYRDRVKQAKYSIAKNAEDPESALAEYEVEMQQQEQQEQQEQQSAVKPLPQSVIVSRFESRAKEYHGLSTLEKLKEQNWSGEFSKLLFPKPSNLLTTTTTTTTTVLQPSGSASSSHQLEADSINTASQVRFANLSFDRGYTVPAPRFRQPVTTVDEDNLRKAKAAQKEKKTKKTKRRVKSTLAPHIAEEQQQQPPLATSTAAIPKKSTRSKKAAAAAAAGSSNSNGNSICIRNEDYDIDIRQSSEQLVQKRQQLKQAIQNLKRQFLIINDAQKALESSGSNYDYYETVIATGGRSSTPHRQQQQQRRQQQQHQVGAELTNYPSTTVSNATRGKVRRKKRTTVKAKRGKKVSLC